MSNTLTASRPALLVNGDDAAFRTMVHNTLAFSARIEEIRARFGSVMGLPGSAYTVLISVAHLQGKDGVGISAIAEHLHLTTAAVTIEVGRLVRLGFVTKASHPIDRRRVLVNVTPKGRENLSALTSIQAPANDALFACLDEKRFRVLSEIMQDLVHCADDSLALLASLTHKRAA